MPKELFNQTLKTTVALTDRVAIGIPGQEGANNITGANLLKQTANWNILSGTITNASLTAGVYTLVHGKATSIVRMTLYNPDGYHQELGGIFQVVDANTVRIDFGGSIDAGNWTYILEYINL